MKKNRKPGKPAARLKRTRNTYEFCIRYPHGTSAINGYRRAARHFGLHTLEDPSTLGTDTCRLFIHKDIRKLREAARVIKSAYASGDESLIEDAEEWLASGGGGGGGVTWFDHDWRYWDQEQDEGALECLGWNRGVVELGSQYRLTIKGTSLRSETMRISVGTTRF
jgi:hypothetical protein